MDELGPRLADLASTLNKAELFKKKIRQDRMILTFEQGAKKFEGKKFADKGFVEEILVKWPAVQPAEKKCSEEALRILALLKGSLKARYNLVPIPKSERYQASKILVKALKSKHDIIRRTAIECLYEIYGRTLLYRHNAPPGHRKERYRKWLKEIEKLRK